METKKVKSKLKVLLKRYVGKKCERYDKLAEDLHIKRRWLIYLLNGKGRASFYVAKEIDTLLEDKTSERIQ